MSGLQQPAGTRQVGSNEKMLLVALWEVKPILGSTNQDISAFLLLQFLPFFCESVSCKPFKFMGWLY